MSADYPVLPVLALGFVLIHMSLWITYIIKPFDIGGEVKSSVSETYLGTMPGIPIVLCSANAKHFDYIVEHVKPEFDVVVIFTTPASALSDLPMMLDYHLSSDARSEGSDVSRSSRGSLAGKQWFSMAFDPTALHEGTIPISPSLFNISALEPQRPVVKAVIVGEGFGDGFADEIKESCGEDGEKVRWISLRDGEKRKDSEQMGRTVKSMLRHLAVEQNGR